MKKIIGFLAGLVLVVSCNDDYLEKAPQNSVTEENAFVTYDNFKAFGWEFYEYFASSNFDQYVNTYYPTMYGDFQAGYSTYLYKVAGDEPNQFRNNTAVAPASGNGWDFTLVRRANLLLSKVTDSSMEDDEKLHWEAIGRFWRAYAYAELISRFGDVPWTEEVLNETSEERFMGRTSRKDVADNVLADLQFAESNIYVDGDGENTINLNVVRAVMSRFTLFEGTWRKYHELGDSEKYIDEAVRVSKALVEDNPAIMDEVDGRYITESLIGQPGILLCQEYIYGIKTHYRARYVRTEAYNYEFPKSTVDMFLSSNGLPIANASNTQYEGDKNVYDQFRNRDLRLYAQVLPPYSIEVGGNLGANPPDFSIIGNASTGTLNTTGFYYDGHTDVTEYIDLMAEKFNPQGKQLPAAHFAGTLVWTSPHITGPGAIYTCSRSGFTAWKEYNIWEDNYGNDTSDKAIFWVEEAMLNLAEAYFEQNGTLSQEIADMTINVLRERAEVAPMDVSIIGEDFDPSRDTTVEPMLWEIRRERFVELLGEGFGFRDIRRWKKGPWYINRPQVGVYLNRKNYYALTQPVASGVPTVYASAWDDVPLSDIDGVAVSGDEGYVQRFSTPKEGWRDQYYLYAIPTNDLVLSPAIEQNPGW